MSAKLPYNRVKLTTLHEKHLQNPPSPKEVRKAERDYLAVSNRADAAAAAMAVLVGEQKRTAEQKRKLKNKQQEAKDRLDEEVAELKAKIENARQRYERAQDSKSKEIADLEVTAGNTYAKILQCSELQKKLDEEKGKAAEALLLANGLGPVTIDGRSFDFGCYGERVYLVPRKVGAT